MPVAAATPTLAVDAGAWDDADDGWDSLLGAWDDIDLGGVVTAATPATAKVTAAAVTV